MQLRFEWSPNILGSRRPFSTKGRAEVIQRTENDYRALLIQLTACGTKEMKALTLDKLLEVNVAIA